MIVKNLHGTPGIVKVGVGEVSRVRECDAIDVLEGKETGIGPNLGCQEQSGHWRFGGLAGVVHQRRVIEGAPHVEGTRAAVAPQAHCCPEGAHESGALEISVEHGDAQLLARGRTRVIPAPTARRGLSGEGFDRETAP